MAERTEASASHGVPHAQWQEEEGKSGIRGRDGERREVRFAFIWEQEAAKLAQEVIEKLEEAEEQCRESLQTEWEECKPCLEDACKNFYTSTCRRGFATFRNKARKAALSTEEKPSVRRKQTPGGTRSHSDSSFLLFDGGLQCIWKLSLTVMPTCQYCTEKCPSTRL